MSASSTIRMAIQDAMIEVADVAKASGPKAPLRRNWKAVAAGLAPASVPVSDRALYRETFALAAENASALVAELSQG